jgi:hypothetical protein
MIRYITLEHIKDTLDEWQVSKTKLGLSINVTPPTLLRGLSNKSDFRIDTYFKIIDYLFDNVFNEVKETNVKSENKVNTDMSDMESREKYINIINKLTNENIKLTEMFLSMTERLLEAKNKNVPYTHSMVAEDDK